MFLAISRLGPLSHQGALRDALQTTPHPLSLCPMLTLSSEAVGLSFRLLHQPSSPPPLRTCEIRVDSSFVSKRWISALGVYVLYKGEADPGSAVKPERPQREHIALLSNTPP
ncbi:hypothetical protein SRHO_G00198620 [Serrasalmus rhombeus]